MTPHWVVYWNRKLKMRITLGVGLFVILAVNLTADSYDSAIEVKVASGKHSKETIAGTSGNIDNSSPQVNQNNENRATRSLHSDHYPETNVSLLLIQTRDGLKQVMLNRRRLSVDIPFTSYHATLEVIPAVGVHSVTINNSPTRLINYTLGLGTNRLDIGLTREIHSENKMRDDDSNKSVKHYSISLNRLNRPFIKRNQKEFCYLKQDCDLKIHTNKHCGLQSLDPHWHLWKNHTGFWKLSCVSCKQEETCLWPEAEWIESGRTRTAVKVPEDKLQSCLANQQLLFLGDSTNRGIMQSVMEKVNTTLYSAEKSHDYIGYTNVGQSTNFSFMYYPAFWMKNRSTFVQTLHNLVNKSGADVNGRRIILVVGGVQWLTKSQLVEIHKFIKLRHIPIGNVYIKTHSSGFHVNVPGLPFHHSEESLQRLIKQNQELSCLAQKYGFQVIDTLNMTLSRYREFLQGKCACHFHQVNEQQADSQPSNQTIQSMILSKLHQLGLVEKTTPSTYHISGNIHTAYTNMLINRMCT